MWLGYQLGSIWDEKTWGTDSFLLTSSLYKIQTGYTTYGGFSGFDSFDYYEITPGIGTFKLVVTSDSLNSAGYFGTWGAFNTSFDIKIKDSFGVVVATADLLNPDINTDAITFTSNTFSSYYVEISNSLFGTFNYAATLLTVTSPPVTDTTPPTIALSSNVSILTAGQTATITFTLSEASTNFTQSDVAVSGGTLSNFTGSGTSYSATFTPTANSTTQGVISVASSTFSDAAGNLNTDGADANNRVTLTVNTVPTGTDVAPPTIALSSNLSSLTAGQTATITFTLSESSTNFTQSDVAVSGGALSNFTGSGTSYSATFTPTTNSTAQGVISVASSTFSDAAGNLNTDGADIDNRVALAINTTSSGSDAAPPTITSLAMTSSTLNLGTSEVSLASLGIKIGASDPLSGLYDLRVYWSSPSGASSPYVWLGEAFGSTPSSGTIKNGVWTAQDFASTTFSPYQEIGQYRL